MNQKQTSLGVALSGVQAEVKKLADVGGVTEDLSAISGKVGMNFSFFVHFFNIFAG